MNRLSTVILIGLAGLLASCGSSVTSSTQAATNYVYTMAVSSGGVDPTRMTLNSGDWSSMSVTVEESYENSAPKALSPQPTVKFYSADSRVSISPAEEVCAGVWDASFQTCAPAVFPASSPNAGRVTIPSGEVVVTAYDATHNVSGTINVSVHPRTSGITLVATDTQYPWPTASNGQLENCVSQNQQVKYVAIPTFVGNAICDGGTCTVNDNDYTWSVVDSTVAGISTFGNVVAVEPGVTDVYAKLNGTVSTPVAFATCPPASITMSSSAFTKGAPVAPFSTADLDDLAKGSQEYLSATSIVDVNGNTVGGVSQLGSNGQPLTTTVPLTFISSNLLTGSFTSVLALTDKLTANTSGRTTVTAACEPATCNYSAPNFILPAVTATGTPRTVTAELAGFGYPVYSNVIGATITGTTGSTVLVTGTTGTDNVTQVHHMSVYDSESMALTQTVELANTPNSLMVAPNGLKAYVGSSQGLIVVDLTTYQPSLLTYPVVGGINTNLVTGAVIGISPDSRYVILSDITNGLVFLVDTTGTKSATRYTLSGIRTATFAADGSNMWIGGDSGVYVYNASSFVPTLSNVSTGVQALAWMPDGQSYFASGALLTNYTTCNDQNPQTVAATSPINLDTTAINGVPHAIGLSGNSSWLDVSVAKSPVTLGATTLIPGNVCIGTVNVGTPVNTPATANGALPCTATQITFSPTLEEEFVTGVDPTCGTSEAVIHGYNVNSPSAFTVATANAIVPLSGGVLNDGRKLYVGSYDSTSKTATLHRIDLSTGTGAAGSLTEDASASVDLIPAYVAVVPK